MKAVLNGVVLAEADREDLVRIEGNWYFPPQSVREGVLTESDTAYTCPWKGAAQYFHISAPAAERADGAWSYPDLRDGAVDRVGSDFAGYVAFAPGVEVVES